MCVSVCNVSSVYERDSVCMHRSVMSRVFMREILRKSPLKLFLAMHIINQ